MGMPQLSRLSHALRMARETKQGLHPVLRSLPDEAWEEAALQAARIADVLVPVSSSAFTTLGGWLDALARACEAIASEAFWDGEGGSELADAFALLKEESRHLARCDLPRAAAVIRHLLHGVAVRPRSSAGSRLSILGLLEARLIRPDVMVLAGLNEGSWPGRPDTGPWINRPMRDILGLRQPEAQIGQTAHDFAQALGCPEVKLLWARRIGDAPATPSRWIHRLQMILATAEMKAQSGKASRWPVLARLLVEPAAVTPCAMPRPRPPAEARPRRLSVTQVETLIRDPYAIYARRILKLVPVDPIAAAPDPRQRGMIFHQAIGDFLTSFPQDLPPDIAERLIALAEEHFAKIEDYPDLVGFWRPRFARIARWFAETEPGLRAGVAQVLSERDGALEFPVMGQPFTLTGRADRIDLLADGSARIIDYKTGAPPSGPQVESGLAPQLTLEAAMLVRGAFPGIGPRDTRELNYVQLTGGEPPGKIKNIAQGGVMDLAGRHFEGLLRILTAFANPDHPYAPRAMMEKEDEASDYDHLSRFREWSLSGGRA